MINWIAVLIKARKGALRFPAHLGPAGTFDSPESLLEHADPDAKARLDAIERRAHRLQSLLGGDPFAWMEHLAGWDDALWHGVEQAIKDRLAEPERPFHSGRLYDAGLLPAHVPAAIAAFARIADTTQDPSWRVGPDRRRVHIHGTMPGVALPFRSRWATDPATLGDLPILPRDAAPDQGLRVGVLPSWDAFLALDPAPGTVLLYPDHGAWSLRRVDWLLDADLHLWVPPTRPDLEAAVRLRRVFPRAHLHLDRAPPLPKGAPGTTTAKAQAPQRPAFGHPMQGQGQAADQPVCPQDASPAEARFWTAHAHPQDASPTPPDTFRALCCHNGALRPIMALKKT